jgi:adenine phosphoribosyltransferase
MGVEFYDAVIGGCERRLPVLEVAPGVSIAFMDIVGDTELIDRSLRELLKLVPEDVEVVLGGDTVGLLIAHHLAGLAGLPYVVARKKRTPVMREALSEQTQSVAASSPSTFWVGSEHARKLHGRHVLVVDEVASTGSTLRALTRLAERGGARQVTRAVIATEGEPRADVLSLVHLPVWVGGEATP